MNKEIAGHFKISERAAMWHTAMRWTTSAWRFSGLLKSAFAA
jgi:hypothetical protein